MTSFETIGKTWPQLSVDNRSIDAEMTILGKTNEPQIVRQNTVYRLAFTVQCTLKLHLSRIEILRLNLRAQFEQDFLRNSWQQHRGNIHVWRIMRSSFRLGFPLSPILYCSSAQQTKTGVTIWHCYDSTNYVTHSPHLFLTNPHGNGT